uniref:E2 ubiquitin-conjugating enzyme n=1 Tax=Paramoeba aestuarina TaxID=180227 RepID=A0A7S4KKK7_9EUKA|mmetsp:Transcript_20788/g.32448  ORF Transcript_20788/g.32448 Transcript_20788/m.32448 type:complete len:168 (+) Transcript_20788:275-778(+)
MDAIRTQRLMKEVQMMRTDPPPGIACWPVSEDLTNLEATILGPDGSPYAGGNFKVKVKIPNRYPMEPPQVQFETQIYHPNVDTSGRICLDIIVMRPKGQWAPSLNVLTVLTSLQSLIAEPNTGDPLMPDIGKEFEQNYGLFLVKAKEMTKKYATEGDSSSSSSSSPS